MEKEFVWRGYSKKNNYDLPSKKEIKHEIKLTKDQYDELWARFKEWKGSQKDFYFTFVNPFRLMEKIRKPKSNLMRRTEKKRLRLSMELGKKTGRMA